MAGNRPTNLTLADSPTESLSTPDISISCESYDDYPRPLVPLRRGRKSLVNLLESLSLSESPEQDLDQSSSLTSIPASPTITRKREKERPVSWTLSRPLSITNLFGRSPGPTSLEDITSNIEQGSYLFLFPG